jgi:transposase
LLQARTVLAEQFSKLDNQVHRSARADKRGRLLTTVPGVGSIVALIFASAIDDPGRLNRPRGGG